MMGTLSIDGKEVLLSRANLIGKGALCAVQVADPRVGHVHALLAWDRAAARWVIQDLCSKNGTRVGEAAVTPGRQVPVPVGEPIVVGGPGGPNVVLTSGAAPGLHATHVATGEQIAGQNLISLPTDAGTVDLFRGSSGWVAELDGLRPVSDGQVLLDGWRVSLPLEGAETVRAMHPLRGVRLQLVRSDDTVQATLETPGRTVDLGKRSHWRYAWELAKQRLLGGPEVDRGWVYHLTAAKEVGVDERSLAQYAFLIRRDLGDAGVLDAGMAIEAEAGRRRFTWDGLTIAQP